MKLKYGSFTHGSSECSVSIARQTVRDNTGLRVGYLERWTIQGMLLATGADLVANLTTRIDALVTAYTSDGSDLEILEDDLTATSHKLDTSNAIGGVKIVSGPSFPRGNNAEYATFRTYTIVAEAKFEDTSPPDLLAFRETISVAGTGGSRFTILIPMRGYPVKQTTARRTPVSLTQDGVAIGRTAYPTPSSPVSLTNENRERRRIVRKNPKRQADGTYREFEISWHYEFAKIADFTAAQKTPNVWGS